jgi:hypothetical protein
MKSLLIIFVILITCSCKKSREKNDDELCTSRNINTTNALRLNGYYYHEYGDGQYRIIYIFYQNGIVVYPGVLSNSEFDNVQDYLSSNSFLTKYKANKLMWGIYSINGANIIIENWYPSENGFPVYIRSGQIQNDSTFHINQSKRCNGSDSEIENILFQYEKIEQKPDSLNQYIP